MFLSKAELEATVKAYDLDVSGLTWPQKQGYVSKYLAANELEVVKPEEEDAGRRGPAFDDIPTDTGEAGIAGVKAFALNQEQVENRRIQGDMTSPSAASASTFSMHIPTPGEPVIIKGKAKRVQADPIEEAVDEWLALGLKNKRLMFAPELITDPNRLIRYREDLGPNATSEDVNYTGEDLDKRNIQGAPGTSNGISGTYQVTEIPGERCVATSTLPKYNAAIYWDFGPDGKPVTYFPIVEFEGRRGYLYKHATIPNVYSTIFADPRMVERGYYQRFRENLSQEPYVFYLAGILAVDIDFTHYMMEEITKEEQRRND